MAGVFGGIKDIFTGGGGAPDFEGLSDRDKKQLINRQMAFGQTSTGTMQDWLNQSRNAYGAQQSLLPTVYGELGLQPQYGDNGQISGFQNTNPQLPSMESLAQQILASGGSPADQQQRLAQLQQQFQGNENELIGRGLNANSMAYNNLQAPQFNAQGLGAMQYATGTAQNQLSAAPFNMEGMDALRYGVGTAQNQLGAPQYNLEGMDALRQNLASAQALQGAPQFNLEGIPAARQNLALLQQLQGPELQRLGLEMHAENGQGVWGNDPNAPEAQARLLSGQYLTNAQRALRGEADVDPTLTRQFQQQEQQLRNQLQASLGPDYATSTAGSNALQDFNKRKAEALYSSNQDLAQRGASNYIGLQGSNLDTQRMLMGIGDPVNSATGLLGNLSNTEQAQRLADRNAREQFLMGTTGQLTQGSLAEQAARQADMQARYQNFLAATGQLGQASLGQQAARQADMNSRYQNLLAASGQLANTSINQQQMQLQDTNARNANFLNTANMLQGIFGTQAQAGLAYENARTQTPFATLSAMSNARQADQAATSTRLNQLYGGIGAGYRDTGLSSIAALTCQLGTSNAALPWASAQWQGDVTSNTTNPNNMFWRNFESQAGSTLGKAVGGAGSVGIGSI